jgi:diaminohydroxyphosphoribosylaminopyrimidine deaminase/5-amino-6-(5-phosphoribosylamino)uracil reductase
MNFEVFMKRCLALAKLGIADAAPNPSVGAVLVDEGRIIGEGYTSPYGGPHGEVNCIEDAKSKQGNIPKSSILYVSLEPCSHYGKTPPCSELIIQEGISTVVVACSDPNPLVAGKGIEKLKAAGIKVIEGVCKEEALELNKRFFTFHLKKRPYITLKWAQSQSGSFAPLKEEQFWITNAKTRALVHSWRRDEMSILVGDRTIQIDNPKLNNRLVEGKSPIRIVINTGDPIDKDKQVLKDVLPTYVFSYEDSASFHNKTFIQLNSKHPVLQQVMTKLHLDNIHSVLIEGGAFTLQQFIDLNLWDEAKIIIGQNQLSEGILAPVIAGELLAKYEIWGDQIKILKNNS